MTVPTSFMYQLTTLAVGRLRTAVLSHTVAQSVTILVFLSFLLSLLEKEPALNIIRDRHNKPDSTPRRAWKWSSQMLCFHVTVLSDGRSRRRQPTGWMRGRIARPTSWLAVPSGRVGRAPSAIASQK